MNLMRNTPNREYAGKAKDVDELETKVVDIVNDAIEGGDIEIDSGTKLYKHEFNDDPNDPYNRIVIISTSATPIVVDDGESNIDVNTIISVHAKNLSDTDEKICLAKGDINNHLQYIGIPGFTSSAVTFSVKDITTGIGTDTVTEL